MAVVKLTRKQIIDAVRQLKDDDRLHVLRELVGEPTPEDVYRAADRLRPEFRMERDHERRLLLLLQKGNAGTLSNEERGELDSLCEEANERTLRMLRKIVSSVAASSNESDRNDDQ